MIEGSPGAEKTAPGACKRFGDSQKPCKKPRTTALWRIRDFPAPWRNARRAYPPPAGRVVSHKAYALPRQGISHREQPHPFTPARAVQIPFKTAQKSPMLVAWRIFVRSIRDLNPGGGMTALADFESAPFDLLGNAPNLQFSQADFPAFQRSKKHV